VSSVILTITDEDFDPKEISKALELTPSQSWKKNDRQTVPGGTIHTFTNAGWKLFQDETVRAGSFEDQLTFWIGLLSPRSSALRSLKERGHRVELLCFSSCGPTFEFSLNNEMLTALSELGVELTVECMLHEERDAPLISETP
jgi:hypothetical protein